MSQNFDIVKPVIRVESESQSSKSQIQSPKAKRNWTETDLIILQATALPPQYSAEALVFVRSYVLLKSNIPKTDKYGVPST